MSVLINASTSTGLVQSADTSGEIELQSNGTTALKVNTNEGIQILNCLGVGNATPSTSGAGITFPATQSASSDANTLDDYEEGTWTPAFDGSGAITYNSQTGTYTKVGRQVTCVFFLHANTSSRTSVSGITGLPFTAANTNYSGVSFSAYEVGSYSGQCNVLGLIANAATTIQFRITSSATQAPTTSVIANLAAGTYIAGSLTYFVA